MLFGGSLVYFKSLSKRWLITFGTVFIVAALGLIFLFNSSIYRPKADSSAFNLFNSLTPYGIKAVSCNPTTLDCPSLVGSNQIIFPSVIQPIAQRLDDLMNDAYNDCFYDSTSQRWLTSKIGGSYQLKIGLASCSFTETVAPDGRSGKVSYSINLGIPSVIFLTDLDTLGLKTVKQKIKTQGSDIIQTSGSATITGTVTGTYPAPGSSYLNFTTNPDQEDTRVGSLDAPFLFNLDSTVRLIDQLVSSAGDEFEINKDDSLWDIDTQGTVNGKIGFDFKGKKNDPASLENGGITVRALDFCPQTCKITDIEELNIKAVKKGKTDGVKGPITVDMVHTETYTGTGKGDLATGTVRWNNDLHITKEDIRKWNHNLSAGANASWTYAGDMDSTADLLPFQNSSKLISNIKKDLDYKVRRSFGATEQSGAHISKHEENIVANGQTTLTRTGTGSRGTGSALLYSGVYDNQKSPFKNCDPNLYVTSPTGQVGQCRDPFDGIDGRYTKSYFIDTLVPGFFTAGYRSEVGKSTIIQSRPVKNLPKTIVFFDSFKVNDPADGPGDRLNIESFLKQAEALGVTVQRQKTNTPETMLKAVESVPSGSWVINWGHGGPQGLVAGTTVVKWSQIRMILEAKQVKLDTFAANSCFAGHSPLADTIVGSISFGIASQQANGIGTRFGIGSNSFHMTSGDLVAILRKLIGCS